MKGRPIGTTELTVEELQQIVELTSSGHSKKKIAKMMGRARSTVAKYQKSFSLY